MTGRSSGTMERDEDALGLASEGSSLLASSSETWKRRCWKTTGTATGCEFERVRNWRTRTPEAVRPVPRWSCEEAAEDEEEEGNVSTATGAVTGRVDGERFGE